MMLWPLHIGCEGANAARRPRNGRASLRGRRAGCKINPFRVAAHSGMLHQAGARQAIRRGHGESKCVGFSAGVGQSAPAKCVCPRRGDCSRAGLSDCLCASLSDTRSAKVRTVLAQARLAAPSHLGWPGGAFDRAPSVVARSEPAPDGAASRPRPDIHDKHRPELRGCVLPRIPHGVRLDFRHGTGWTSP